MTKNKIQTLLTITTIATLLLGCGNTSDSQEAISKYKFQGKVVDTIVEGMHYTCGGDQGFTDVNGEFGPCDIAATVDFSIGNAVLATNVVRPADNIFTVNDMLGLSRATDPATNNQITNVGSFLLSLDNDGNANNNIVIDQRIITALNTHLLAVTAVTPSVISALSDAQIQTIVTNTANDVNATLNLNLQYIGPVDAASHISQTLTDVKNNVIVAPAQPIATGATGASQI